ncbi:hypothetical protein F5884DRAFT_796157 [Xylogone sp. PMI_703]|nr:hypothetical protein F5884DRAFT_796157 [Xylogone sp. PMI_703]
METSLGPNNGDGRKPGILSSQVAFVNPSGYTHRLPPIGRPNRVYIHGVWDLFHYGHVRCLAMAKNTIPHTYLIVGVTEDNDTLKAKGLTVMSGAERAEVVRACKYVDEVIEDCPPVLLPEFMEKYDIDYFAYHSEPLSSCHPDPYEFVKRDSRFLEIPRTKDISSTAIVTRVIRDREKYVARQLRWGVSREAMNIA